jgi:hypothetical protein
MHACIGMAVPGASKFAAAAAAVVRTIYFTHHPLINIYPSDPFIRFLLLFLLYIGEMDRWYGGMVVAWWWHGGGMVVT